jgi:thiosulfate reductase cytochrome b subunit
MEEDKEKEAEDKEKEAEDKEKEAEDKSASSWRDFVVSSKRDHWKLMLPLFILQFGTGAKASGTRDSIISTGVHLATGTIILGSTIWLVYMKYYLVTKNVKRRALWPGVVDRSIRLHYLAFSSVIIIQLATKFIPNSTFISMLGIKGDTIHRYSGFFGLSYSVVLLFEKLIFKDLAFQYPKTMKYIQETIDNIPVFGTLINL